MKQVADTNSNGGGAGCCAPATQSGNRCQSSPNAFAIVAIAGIALCGDPEIRLSLMEGSKRISESSATLENIDFSVLLNLKFAKRLIQ